jgi:hypothetical protein
MQHDIVGDFEVVAVIIAGIVHEQQDESRRRSSMLALGHQGTTLPVRAWAREGCKWSLSILTIWIVSASS